MTAERPEKAVVLLSGGVDSTTLLVYLSSRLQVPEIRAISFRYGQKHVCEVAMAEWQAQQAGVREHRIVDVPHVGALTQGGSALTDPSIEIPELQQLSDAEKSQPPTYVPNRNMMLLSMAAAYAESTQTEAVYYGAQAQDEYGYWDCTTDFLERMNSTLALNRKVAIRIVAPFMSWRKADVIRLGDELGVDYAHTWTCYRGEDQSCGTCPSCVERERAFVEARRESTI